MIHTLVSSNGRSLLNAFGKDILTNGSVQNLENGLRKTLAVFSENEDGSRGVLYSPQVFPNGIWKVGRPQAVDPAKDPDGYEQPFFIPTDAWQLVEEYQEVITDHIWYGPKTGREVKDFGYGLHFSTYAFTLGCIRIIGKDDLLWLVEQINGALDAGDVVRLAIGQLEVTEAEEVA